MDRLIRRRLVWALKIVITVTLLVWVLRLADPAALGAALSQLDAVAVLAALAALALAYAIAFWRWGILLRCVGVGGSLRRIVPEYLLSMFYNHVLPSSVGGDAVRVYYLHRRGFELHGLVASTVMDRLLGLVGVVLISALAWSWISGSYGVSTAFRIGPLAFVCAGAVAVVWASRRLSGSIQRTLAGAGFGRMQKALLRLVQALDSYTKMPGSIVKALALSVIAQSIVVLAYLTLGTALGIQLAWLDYFFVVPSVMLMQIIPISFAGMGVREAGLVGILTVLGVSVEQAVALSLAYLAVFWLSVIPGAVVALRFFIDQPKVSGDERGVSK